VIAVAWLGEETNRPGLHGACPHVFIGMTRQENNGNAMALGDQPLLQVNTG